MTPDAKHARRRVLAAAALLPTVPAWGSTRRPVAELPASQVKILRCSLESPETGFDPAQLNDFYSRIICRHLFDAPVRFAYLAKAGSCQPNTLVAMPTMSADSREFLFRVKPGILFHDDAAFKGQRRELVAEDYVYSIKRLADPRWKAPHWADLESLRLVGLRDAREKAIKTGRFDYDARVEGLRAIDRYSFVIRTEQPTPRLMLADPSSYGAVAREVVEHYGDDIMAHPVGTGPFRLIEWRRSSRIVLERFADYRDDVFGVEADPDDADAQAIAARMKGQRLPLVDRIEIDIISEQQPRWLAFLQGAQDSMDRMPLLFAPLALPDGKPSAALRQRKVRVERAPQIDVTLQVFNMEDPQVGGYTPEKIALRRAISMAVDTPEFIRSLYKGQGFIAQTPFLPKTYGYDAHAVSEMGMTDPARANALLDAYGYDKRDEEGFRTHPDGSRLSILSSTQPEQAQRVTDEIFKKSFNRIGVRIDFSIFQWAEQMRRTRSGQFQMWVLGNLGTSPDGADSFLRAYSPGIGGQNLARFKLPEFDALFDRQQSMPDGAERLAVLQRMSALVMAYMPMHYMVHRYAIDLTYPWVLNQRRWPFIPDWWRYADIDLDLQRKLTS